MYRHILILLILVMFSCDANAKKVVYQYIQSDGTIAFTDQQPLKQQYNVLSYECFACDLNSQIDWYHTQLFNLQYQHEITQASKEHQIPVALIRAMIHAESAFDASAVSKKGAIGLMQLMPETATELGVKNPRMPHENIKGGVKYLAQLIEAFNGNIKLATAAYNAGPGAVRKHQGIPPFEETKAYVKRVSILHKRYQQATRIHRNNS